MKQHEVIAEFYQVRVESGELGAGDVPGPKRIASEWRVSIATANRARTTLRRSDLVTNLNSALPLGPISDMDFAFRFLTKVQPRNIDGCLLWGKALDIGGYGRFWLNGRDVPAHRVAWEYKYGLISDGMELDHVYLRGCRSKACVNTDHLELVTSAENNRRSVSAERWRSSIWVRTEPDED
ncbi:hypothetical protein GCM10010215_39980 [Streptomyces virginiae]|uniref:HNH nuclease domain-containing protein n=1 Tax=Streptomyces virginiae TaxID=1961 RepID=A0ABQ3NZJ3_STRVG|nr:HNH endonuclease signature motif containing protein [Streptomyces virginiae]MBP2343801.1 hypothetical protein [Streptomyces virginiae]GGQ10944.1 hypothetical protein GCM10010215_39980 [Streptomyces virginiae]GHI18193.1 hypothetical protein Scinn_76560 [Streptomyces virginiae]